MTLPTTRGRVIALNDGIFYWMFHSKIFTTWFATALVVWVCLFYWMSSLDFLVAHWHYPAIMVLGAFVAGLTPEGGGAVAFPVLSIFFNIDRVLARDFSLMIQSIGMTSASIFILTHCDTKLRAFKALGVMIPICFVGFVLGMLTLQSIPVYIIQALFLSLITAFATAYAVSDHRGNRDLLELRSIRDYLLLGAILIVGGMCASLFGTGSDILLYTVLVTQFRMTEKTATRMSIMLMAGISVLGYGYRHFIDANLSSDQYSTWLCAYPVVLFMAPFGAYILSKIDVEWMLKGIVVLNIGQLLYFNINRPAPEKLVASLLFVLVLLYVFVKTMSRLSVRPAVAFVNVAASRREPDCDSRETE